MVSGQTVPRAKWSTERIQSKCRSRNWNRRTHAVGNGKLYIALINGIKASKTTSTFKNHNQMRESGQSRPFYRDRARLKTMKLNNHSPIFADNWHHNNCISGEQLPEQLTDIDQSTGPMTKSGTPIIEYKQGAIRWQSGLGHFNTEAFGGTCYWRIRDNATWSETECKGDRDQYWDKR